MDLDRCITRSPAASAIRTRLRAVPPRSRSRSEEHTSELQSRLHLVCRLLLEKKKQQDHHPGPAQAARHVRRRDEPSTDLYGEYWISLRHERALPRDVHDVRTPSDVRGCCAEP